MSYEGELNHDQSVPEAALLLVRINPDGSLTTAV